MTKKKKQKKEIQCLGFMDAMIKEVQDKMLKDIEAQERRFWELREIDAKMREDIKNGKPIYFGGFINKLTNVTP